MTRTTTFTGFSRGEIEQKIDVFLTKEKPFKALDMIMPGVGHVAGFTYRGLNVREWCVGDNVRYDSTVELIF